MNAVELAKPVLKAVVGFLAPAATLITAAVLPDSPGGVDITTGEWVTAVCACVISAAAVWGVPNLPRKTPPDA